MMSYENTNNTGLNTLRVVTKCNPWKKECKTLKFKPYITMSVVSTRNVRTLLMHSKE